MSRYIDVEALGIGKANPDAFEDAEYAHGWNAAIEIIEAAPAADVAEVRHGRWAKKIVKLAPDCKGKMQPYMWQPNTCSICEVGQAVRTEYCPNCGAGMDRTGTAPDKRN